MTLVRLLPAVLLLLLSSLAVLPAPTHLLWMIAIGVTEWGHVLALICLGAAVPLFSNSRDGKIAAALCITAAVLALTPVIRAVRFVRTLPGQLERAFGAAVSSRDEPLVYSDLFRGLSPPEVKPETIIYSKAGNEDLSLDFYRSLAPGPSPLVVSIHGGSWQSGDNKDFIPMDRYLASRGFAVADVMYRLAPQWRFPAAIDDVRASIEFLRKQAGPLGIDPNRIVLLGRSAGGQIALTVAYSANDPGIRGVISYYAPTDLRWSWDHPGNPLVIDTRSVLSDYLGGSPSDVPAGYDAASPIRLITAQSPPTLLFHGGRDELVSSRHTDVLDRLLGDAHVPHLSISPPWATHGFDYILRGPGGQVSVYAVEWFLKRVTRRAAN